MKTRSIENLLQGMEVSQHSLSRYANASFEDILLETFEEVHTSKQTHSKDLSQNEPDKVSEKINHIHTFFMLSTMLTPWAKFEEGGITSKADISSQAEKKNDAFSNFGKHLYYHEESVSELQKGLKTSAFQEYDRPMAETMASDVKQSRISQDVKYMAFEEFSADSTLQYQVKNLSSEESISEKWSFSYVFNKSEEELRNNFNARQWHDEGEKNTNLESKEKKAEVLLEENVGSVRFKEEGLQRVERLEKPQIQYVREVKNLSLRFEEGSIRMVLTGDRLRLFINLKEDLYAQPSTIEVQKLLQSLQSIGLNLEVLRLNGNNLYSSEQRHGSKKENKEKTLQAPLSEFTEETKRSFSLYL